MGRKSAYILISIFHKKEEGEKPKEDEEQMSLF